MLPRHVRTVLLPAHLHLRQLLVLVVLVLAFCLLTAYLALPHVLDSRRPLVVKLHSSEQRFIEEALHEILLVPDKLESAAEGDDAASAAADDDDEASLEEKCQKLSKGKCSECVKGRRGGRRGDDEREEVKVKDDTAKVKINRGHLEQPVQEVWPARRREWLEDEGMERMRRLLKANSLFQRNVHIMRLVG